MAAAAAARPLRVRAETGAVEEEGGGKAGTGGGTAGRSAGGGGASEVTVCFPTLPTARTATVMTAGLPRLDLSCMRSGGLGAGGLPPLLPLQLAIMSPPFTLPGPLSGPPAPGTISLTSGQTGPAPSASAFTPASAPSFAASRLCSSARKRADSSSRLI